MAKNMAAATILVAAVFLCLSTLASASDFLFIEGRVYCDTCRVQFETKITEYMEGATVRLECRNRITDQLTYTYEDITDKDGVYHIPVEGDHEEEICEVKVHKSSRDDCSEPMIGREAARVLITKNVGVAEPVRYANALGFMKKEALSGCENTLLELGFLPSDLL